MAAAKKKENRAIRYRKLRDDASIAAAELTISDEYGLPTGSVRLILPSGRKARGDKKLAPFREDWGA